MLENVGDGEQRQLTRPVGGTYEVDERITAAQASQITLAQYESSTTCVNRRNNVTVVPATGELPVSLHLAQADDDVVCTITNRRPGLPPDVEPPPGPPIVPPPPCTDADECTNDLAAVPRLTVTRRMPARGRVGDRLPVTITVRNVGPDAAHSVRLLEARPTGGRIVRVRQGGSIRRSGSAARWSLATLAPGASRTVHATMLVTRTGLHTNTAAAAARNADPAFDVAAVRARAAPAANFTG